MPPKPCAGCHSLTAQRDEAVVRADAAELSALSLKEQLSAALDMLKVVDRLIAEKDSQPVQNQGHEKDAKKRLDSDQQNNQPAQNKNENEQPKNDLQRLAAQLTAAADREEAANGVDSFDADVHLPGINGRQLGKNQNKNSTNNQQNVNQNNDQNNLQQEINSLKEQLVEANAAKARYYSAAAIAQAQNDQLRDGIIKENLRRAHEAACNCDELDEKDNQKSGNWLQKRQYPDDQQKYQQQLEKSQQEIQMLGSIVTNLKQNLCDKNLQIERLQSEHNKVRTHFEEVIQQLNNANGENLELRKDIQQKDQLLKQLNEETERQRVSYEKQLQQTNDQTLSAQKESDAKSVQLNSKINELNISIAQKDVSLQKLQTENEILKDKLTERNNQILELKNDKINLFNQIQMQKDVNSLKSELEDMKLKLNNSLRYSKIDVEEEVDQQLENDTEERLSNSMRKSLRK